MRRHQITASKAHDVKTRMLTHKSKGEADCSSVFARVSREMLLNARLSALKHGLAMEEDATAKFFENFAREHKSAKLKECGLFLSKEPPFIVSCPDRIVYLSGKSCLQVKCPFSIAHTSPIDAKLPYLAIDSVSNTLCLRRNHKYFTKCQVQMAATKSKQCYFHRDGKLLPRILGQYKGFINLFIILHKPLYPKCVFNQAVIKVLM